MATTRPQTAHPYNDTDVIDARAPRFNQGTVGVVAVSALLTGWWWPFALLALQLTPALDGSARGGELMLSGSSG